jgi:purine nucleosidase
MRLTLDCDPGHDDAIAILLALGDPGADLRAVTTVSGNGALDKVTHNARRVLALADARHLRVAPGAAGPRVGLPLHAPDVHGESALDGPALPAPDPIALDPRPVHEVLAAECDNWVAVGPLTNIADALDRGARPRDRLVVMGGSTGRGNTTPLAEFNVLCDPEAADVCLRAGLDLTLIGLNVTHQALATPDRTRGLPRVVREWLDFFAAAYRERFAFEAPPLHDPVAVAALLEPQVVEEVECFVGVELEGALTRGATVCDLHGRLGRPANARVAVALDAERFWWLVRRALARLPALAG